MENITKTTNIEFKGTALGYFKIWAVNLIFSVITLGLYSAKAKVRRKSYFYENTEINGHSFKYHASARQILIARIIVLAVVLSIQLLYRCLTNSIKINLAATEINEFSADPNNQEINAFSEETLLGTGLYEIV